MELYTVCESDVLCSLLKSDIQVDPCIHISTVFRHEHEHLGLKFGDFAPSKTTGRRRMVCNLQQLLFEVRFV